MSRFVTEEKADGPTRGRCRTGSVAATAAHRLSIVTILVRHPNLLPPGGATLIIRADASATVGMGHVMRCLALGQAWRDSGGRVVFLTTTTNEWLLLRLSEEGFESQTLGRPYPAADDWQATRAIAMGEPDPWVLLDGYHFDLDYQRRVKDSGFKLVVIDDTAALPHYYADVLVNQNVYAEDLIYSCEPYTRRLLGSRYALLRREFAAYRGVRRAARAPARRVLVTMGGADPQRATLKALAALHDLALPELEVRVMVGAASAQLEGIRAAANSLGCATELMVAAPKMGENLAWADVAIAAAGTTAIELAFMGVPALLVVAAENQVPIAAKLEQLGAARDLGWVSQLSAARIMEGLRDLLCLQQTRAAMAERGQQLVDGEGAERVAATLSGEKVRLRWARAEDCERLWGWRNQEQVRAMSFSSEPITRETHQSWFERKLADPACLLFVGVNAEEQPVGQVRFDLGEDASAEVSILIADQWRGQGYGTALLGSALRRMFAVANLRAVHALIKLGNGASIRMFERVGFHQAAERSVDRIGSLHYVWRER
jgi:UDP-2,4-diacetamido-2,4,6-trideoxy-beta-L-altropyranose hydrolase